MEGAAEVGAGFEGFGLVDGVKDLAVERGAAGEGELEARADCLAARVGAGRAAASLQTHRGWCLVAGVKVGVGERVGEGGGSVVAHEDALRCVQQRQIRTSRADMMLLGWKNGTQRGERREGKRIVDGGWAC